MQSRFIRCLFVASVLVLLGGADITARADEDYRTIGTDELKNWLQSAAPPTLIYSLSYVEFEEQRIPGSICIPVELMAQSTDLPTSKDQPLVFYCKGPG